jgi:PTS system mannose-specific IIB component
VVVDEALVASEWERELYALGVPEGTEALFVDLAVARESLEQWEASPLRTILLTRDLGTMAALAGGGALAGQEVNLGGIHFSAGREQVLPYLFLSSDDRRALELMAQEGLAVSARDLPASGKVGLEDLLR